MVAPINYIQDVQSPFQAAAQGFQFGSGIQQMQAAREAQQLKLQQDQRAMEQQQALSDRIQSVMSNPNATAKDYAQLSMMMPKDQAESTRKAWDMLDAEKQKSRLSKTGQVLAALNSNSPEIAQDLLAEEAAALRNSGDEAGAKAAETYAQIAKLNPAMARTNICLLLTQIPGGDKVIEGVTKLGTERRAEEKAPFEYSKAESESIIKEAEGKFRKEYSDQTKGYQEVKAAFGRIKAAEDNAVGDLSLIFSYMKMLDPGSVVREGEFATAQNAAGVDAKIQNIYNKVASGERLTEGQRKAFKGQAGKLYASAADHEKTVRSGIERISKGYGLEPKNIFYSEKESVPGEAQPVTAPSEAPPGAVRRKAG